MPVYYLNHMGEEKRHLSVVGHIASDRMQQRCKE